MKVKNKNIMKNLLLTLLLSFIGVSTFAQSLDISNGSFRIGDSSVIVSDTLEYDMTGILFYDIYNSDKGDLFDMLANALDMGLTKGPDNLMTDPKTDLDFLIVDYRMSRHRKRILKDIKTKLSDKVVIYYLFDDSKERQDLHTLNL